MSTLDWRESPRVSDIHDLHIWTLTSNVFAMSAHVKIKQEYVQQTNNLLRKINEVLKEKFGINHCTVQIEHDLITPDKH
jgi:cobalt-zinc-cadmium efflux system protein